MIGGKFSDLHSNADRLQQIKTKSYVAIHSHHMQMDPVEFIDKISSKQHILQVITNQDKAKQVQFRFIRNGLLKKEHCTYMTHESPQKIKYEMVESGIDVERFVADSLLKIYKVPDIIKYPGGPLEGFKKMIAEIMAGTPPREELLEG